MTTTTESTTKTESTTNTAGHSQTKPVSLFGIELDAVSRREAVTRLHEWIRDDLAVCRYVVTPNVDHIVMLQHDVDLRAAYSDASLVVADGWPVVLASRILAAPVPERVAGSDLVPELFDTADRARPLRVFLLGAAPGVAEQAARRIESQWGAVEVVGCYSPPIGFETSDKENKHILRQLAAHQPDLLVIGLGAPKQELWIHRFHQVIPAKIAICAGATIDFLAGHKSRAPRWVQRFGMEWLHRVLSEPKRLARRYFRDAWIFPRIVLRELLRKLIAK